MAKEKYNIVVLREGKPKEIWVKNIKDDQYPKTVFSKQVAHFAYELATGDSMSCTVELRRISDNECIYSVTMHNFLS